MRLATIASGSSGNCTYIGTENTHLLIDAGVSMKRITEGLHELGLTPDDVSAIFVTHEHSDHISGLPMLEKHYRIPLYASAGTLEGIAKIMDPALFREISGFRLRAQEDVTLGELTVRPFAIPHDAAEPFGFSVRHDQDGKTKKVALATDLGHYDETISTALSGADALVLESNHDIRMLQAGPYPWHLKRRILSETGHLSNDDAGRLLTGLLHDGLKGILLAHLSEVNNYPELAYEAARVEIEMSDAPYHAEDFRLQVAPRSELSEILEI
ncbi:MAG: MBL fold metallo-hydrolase [Lachnospiraceae bacterium]|nr:MBL fold metallo-hydrolase [Lachnospiraceae bacterium]